MDKSKPLKPLIDGNPAVSYWICPTCKYREEMVDADGEFHGVSHNYCPNCGQAIEVEEYE